MAEDTINNYSYDDVPTIKAFSEDNSFIRGLMGPVGGGKSVGCVMEIIKRAAEQKPSPDGIRRSRWAVIRNTYKQLDDTTIKTFRDWLPFHKCGKYKIAEHTFFCDVFEGIEFEILFRALDRPDHIGNLLSLELTGAWVNEARDVPKTIIDALGGRVGRYPSSRDGGASWFGIIMDTNPPDDDSWWYKLFEEDRPKNVQIFKQPSGLSENAENHKHLLNNRGRLYYKNLSIGKDEDFIKVYIQGQYGYVKDGKPVYPEYNDATHCKDVLVPEDNSVTFYRGWDFGLTPACCFSYVDTKGRWIVFDELVATDRGIDRFSDEVQHHCVLNYHDIEWVDIGDPAGNQRAQTDERTCFDVMIGKGINIMGGDQDPNIRVESVKRPLSRMTEGEPDFLLHPRCKMLRKGFKGQYQYRRVKTAQERYGDKPDKNKFSHVHDALQYVATHIFARYLRGVKYTPQKELGALPTFEEVMSSMIPNKDFDRI